MGDRGMVQVVGAGTSRPARDPAVCTPCEHLGQYEGGVLCGTPACLAVPDRFRRRRRPGEAATARFVSMQSFEAKMRGPDDRTSTNVTRAQHVAGRGVVDPSELRNDERKDPREQARGCLAEVGWHAYDHLIPTAQRACEVARQGHAIQPGVVGADRATTVPSAVAHQCSWSPSMA